MRKLVIFQLLIVFVCVSFYSPVFSIDRTANEKETLNVKKSVSSNLSVQSGEEKKKEKKKTYVYITQTGKKYHTKYCSYLKSRTRITLDEAKRRGYKACSRCDPPR